MKKIILTAILLFSVKSFAQKTIYVFNGSSFPVSVVEIRTQTLPLSNTFLRTNNFTNSGVLQPGEFLILENTNSTTRFPFSFVSTQLSNIAVNNWRRTIGSLTTTISNSTAYNDNGESQVFSRIACLVGVNGSLGRFVLGLNESSIVPGDGWIADYSVNTDPAFPNLQETVITISDL